MKHIYISATSDLSYDQRILKVATTLSESNSHMVLVGKKSPHASSIPFENKGIRPIFNKGPLFYASFNVLLFFYLIRKKPDILVANDLDVLLANFLVAKILRVPLVFDSHEYFTGLPSLKNRKWIRGIWKFLERYMVPKLEYITTVSQSIADKLEEEYGKKVWVIRNMAKYHVTFIPKTKEELGLALSTRVIIIQGAGINPDQGAEELVHALEYLENIHLLIIGEGTRIPALKKMVKISGLHSKVTFIPKIPYTELMGYTQLCDLGVNLSTGTSLNNRYSLPNKLFDYIRAGIPVLSSSVPEVDQIIRKYNLGVVIPRVEPKIIAEAIKNMLSDEARLIQWKKNAQMVAKELNWETEEKKLIQFYRNVGLRFEA